MLHNILLSELYKLSKVSSFSTMLLLMQVTEGYKILVYILLKVLNPVMVSVVPKGVIYKREIHFALQQWFSTF